MDQLEHDGQGWQYGVSFAFTLGKFTAKNGTGDFVRQRLWSRRMKGPA